MRVESLKSKLAKDAMGDVMDQVEEVDGVKVLAVSVEDVDMNGLRDLGRPAQGEDRRRRGRDRIQC